MKRYCKRILLAILVVFIIYYAYNLVLAQLTKPYPEQEFSLSQHLSANEWELSFDTLTTDGSRLPGYENRSWVPSVIWAIDLTIINNGEDGSYVRNDMFQVFPTAGTPVRIYDEPNKAIISEQVQPGEAIKHQLVFLVERNCRSVEVFFRPDGPEGEEFSTTISLPRQAGQGDRSLVRLTHRLQKMLPWRDDNLRLPERSIRMSHYFSIAANRGELLPGENTLFTGSTSLSIFPKVMRF